MFCTFRLALAAIHFNENSGRAQAVTKSGELRFAVSFPKAKKGEGVAKEVKVDQSFGKTINKVNTRICSVLFIHVLQ